VIEVCRPSIELNSRAVSRRETICWREAQRTLWDWNQINARQAVAAFRPSVNSSCLVKAHSSAVSALAWSVLLIGEERQWVHNAELSSETRYIAILPTEVASCGQRSNPYTHTHTHTRASDLYMWHDDMLIGRLFTTINKRLVFLISPQYTATNKTKYIELGRSVGVVISVIQSFIAGVSIFLKLIPSSSW